MTADSCTRASSLEKGRWRYAAWLVCTAVCALLAEAAFAQRELREIPDPDPEIERQSLQLAEGFEINLFAADPAIAKPIQMNFDSQGRLWVASSEVYPHIKPGQQPRDKVLILEDVDGDGRCDKTTIFADDLLIPTGVEPGDGGAYVANSTQLLHLQDTDGDGRADARRIVLSGFGAEDTHHILHTFRWGPDGMLYFNQSIYIHSHLETPYGVRRLNGGGIWQFRPETMALEVYLRGLVNPWGHHFDRWGQSLATDGAGSEGINFVVPGAYYTTAVGATRILHGLNPGSPKHCGLEVISGRHLPEDWQGNLLTNDFRANRVCRFVLSEDGSGFASRQQPELIKSNNVAFRPIDVKMGPDGAIYIADWYNPIIQHGEVDFRDPRRDHVHGRIWRVTAKDRPLVPRPLLRGAATSELLEALKAPEDWTRHHARLELKSRGAEIAVELAAWVERLDPTDPEVEHHRLEALWTFQAIDVPEPNLLGILLRAKDHRARAAATRVVPHWRDRLTLPLALLGVQVRDEHPRVRLEAVRALATFRSVPAMDVALRALDQPTDRFLDYALWLTSRELAPYWLPALAAGELDFQGRERQLIFALDAVDSPDTVKPLVMLLEGNQVPADQENTVLSLLARWGGPDELAIIFRRAVDTATPDEQKARLMEALVQAAAQRKVRPRGDLSALQALLDAKVEPLQAAALRAAGLWQLTALREPLTRFAADPQVAGSIRQAALDALVQIGGDESRQAIDRLTQPDQPFQQRRVATLALANLDLKGAAAAGVELLKAWPPEENVSALIEAFVSRDGGAEALVAALSGQQLPLDVAKLAIRAARSGGRDQSALVATLQSAAGISGQEVPLTPEQLAALVAEVQTQGNPARGEAIFRRDDQTCLKCHAIGGAGGQVGPDLSSIGASAQVDYLIESILVPNKAIKENYHSLVVATNEGRILSGVRVRENDRELVLRNAEDREVVIPKTSIDEQTSGGSIMPAGLADTLTTAEIADLVRFLSELGKVGPYAVGPARLVRRWRVLEPTEEAMQQLRRTNSSATALDHPAWNWLPAYSRVSGDLPLDSLPSIQIHQGVHPMSYLRFEIDVSTAGPLQLRFNSAAGLECWLDAASFPCEREVTLEPSPGRHTVTIALDRRQRNKPLRVELDDLPGSSAQAQIVGGK
jgi:putative heme-binding domain-containing protein